MRARVLSCLFSLLPAFSLLGGLLLAPHVSAGDEKKGGPPKPVTITAQRMEANRKLHQVTYLDNVIVKKEDLTIYAPRIVITFDEKMEEIERINAEGGVRVVDPEKTATAEKATYLNDQDVLVLTGNPRVWQGDNVITGAKITVFRAEDRAVVEGDDKQRVTTVYYQRGEEEEPKKGPLPEKPGGGGKGR